MALHHIAARGFDIGSRRLIVEVLGDDEAGSFFVREQWSPDTPRRLLEREVEAYAAAVNSVRREIEEAIDMPVDFKSQWRSRADA